MARRRTLRALFSLADAPSLPLTGERHPLRRESARWLLIGGAVSIGAGGLIGLLWLVTAARTAEPLSGAPRLELPKRQFRPGLRGPVLILGELSVESGTDPVTQAGPRPGAARQAAPQPAVTVPGEVGLPVEIQVEALAGGTTSVAGTDSATGSGPPGAVEMHAPAQVNPCYVLEEVVQPQYPAGVDETVLRLPQIKVEAAFFVSTSGAVTASYILESEGGALFDQAVLDAVNAWRFTPSTDPACPPLGFWVRLPVVFHSPYGLR
jgi:TonB family protein